MIKACSHKGRKIWRDRLGVAVRSPAHGVCCYCGRCGTSLPMGRARDTIRVKIEIRAAELANLVMTPGFEPCFAASTDLEDRGMAKGQRDGDRDKPLEAQEWAGWLCWQICLTSPSGMT